MATERLTVEIDVKNTSLNKKVSDTTKELNKLESQVDETDGSLDEFGSTSESSGNKILGFSKGVAAAAVAIAGVAVETKKAIALSDEFAVSYARTEAIIKATGQAAGFTAEQLREQADALALSTLASQQDVQAAQAQLLTFNRVSGEVFTEAIELSQDLAEVGFGSITSSATQLGKALQDPITGISSLTRVGVTFNEVQKEQIRLLVESGKQAEAQRIILDALQTQVGGAGVAVAKDSLAGKVDTAGQLWGEFTTTLAEKSGAVSVTKGLVDLFNESIQALNESLQGPSLDEQLALSDAAIANLQEQIVATQAAIEQQERLQTLGGGADYGGLFRDSQQLNESRTRLIVIESNLAKQQVENERIRSEIAQRDKARDDAKAAAAQVQAQADLETTRRLEEQKLQIQAESDAKQAEIEAAADARRQASIDQQAQSIVESYLSQEEQLLLAAQRQSEIIDQSNLDAQEKVDARFSIWEAYYADLEKLRQGDVKNSKAASRQEELIGRDTIRAAYALNSALLDDNKAVKAGIIVADTASNVVKSVANNGGVPLGLPAGAAAAALGVAQLASLESSGRGGGSIASAPAASPTTPVETPEITEPESLVASASDVGSGNNIVIKVESDDSATAEFINGILSSAQVSGVI